MNPATLLEIAKDHQMWLRKSADLRTSAAALWEAYRSEAKRWAQLQGLSSDEANAVWTRAMAHLTAAKLLYGFALETAFKAVILRDRPDEVEFTVRADGTGLVLEAALERIGVRTKQSGHDLVKLAESAGLLDSGTTAVFPDTGDLLKARAILTDLGAFTVWIGRYPTPSRVNDQGGSLPQLASEAMGDEMRRWTEPLLDRCHQ